MHSSFLNPKNQTKLYIFKDVLTDFAKLYNKNQLPKKIILSGQKGIGKSTLAYHLINYIFSENEKLKYDLDNCTINDQNKSFNFIQKNSHPNFHLIDVLDEKKNIEINQIREMISYANKSSFNNSAKIILIDNIEKLNVNSVNALLKITEETIENLYFILIYDNTKKILDTLKSRFLKYNLSITNKQSLEITNNILGKPISDIINIDLINYYNTPGDYINLINFSNDLKLDLKQYNIHEFLNTIINNNYYKKNSFFKENIFRYIELYFNFLVYNSSSKKRIDFLYHEFIYKISNLKKFNLDYESFFIDLKKKLLNE